MTGGPGGPSFDSPRSALIFANPFSISTIGVLKGEGVRMFIPLLVVITAGSAVALVLKPQNEPRTPKMLVLGL